MMLHASPSLWAPSIPLCFPLCQFFRTSHYPTTSSCIALHYSLLTEARNPSGRTSIYTISRSYHQPMMKGESSSSKSDTAVSDHQVAAAEETFRRYSCTECNRNGSGVAIVWFRNDLRILDNEALYRAWKSSEAVLPVYCIDPRLFGKTHYFGFPKTGELRAQFLLESLVDLKRNLLKRGLNLLVRHGKPEEILPSIVQSIGAHTVYAHKETCSEELMVEKLVSKGLEKVALPSRPPASLKSCHPKLQLVWGCTMYHLDDLPFRPGDVPDVYTQFRKAVEWKCKVRPCYKLPVSLAPLPTNSVNEIEVWGEIPSLHQLGLCIKDQSSLGVMCFIGGERAALARVHEYFWEKDMLRLYKETRNGMLGPDYSTKFSPWLAFGSLSPRYIYEEVKKYESERVANASTYWILFELIWRDYFRFISIKYGNSIFHLGGPRRVKGIEWSHNPTLFQCWRDGRTGYPFIDANMKELLSTGFMSNRGRQVVCSFLVRDMGLDWRMGAEWFETSLIDYDPCSNYGNWTYGAGVGNDPREDRYFSIPKQVCTVFLHFVDELSSSVILHKKSILHGSRVLKIFARGFLERGLIWQAQTYDPDGEYVAHWLPEIAKLPKEMHHFPGKSYVKPVVPLKFTNAKCSYDQPREQLKNNKLDFSKIEIEKGSQKNIKGSR